MRGVGAHGGFTRASDQPVGVVMGLVPVLEGMVDVERIEALKGPQRTQFGKNASSGVISISTRRPKLGKFEGAGSTGFGSLEERDLNGTLNVPLSLGRGPQREVGRSSWLRCTSRCLFKARSRNDVRGYWYWSFIDDFEWVAPADLWDSVATPVSIRP